MPKAAYAYPIKRKCKHCSIEFSTMNALTLFCSHSCKIMNYRPKKRISDKIYVAKTKHAKSEYDKKYYEKNTEKIKYYTKEYRQKNKHLRWEKEKKRLKESPSLNLYKNILTVIGANIKKGRASAYNKTFKMLGYSLDQLILRLKSTLPKGYTWEDFRAGKLHIDHIKPHSLFTYTCSEDQQFKECWGLNNLRLLQKEINIKRQNKYELPEQANRRT